MILYSVITTLGISLLALIIYAVVFVGRRSRNLPPGKSTLPVSHKIVVYRFTGPPTWPVIGNAHQIPSKGAHFQFVPTRKNLPCMKHRCADSIAGSQNGQNSTAACTASNWVLLPPSFSVIADTFVRSWTGEVPFPAAGHYRRLSRKSWVAVTTCS